MRQSSSTSIHACDCVRVCILVRGGSIESVSEWVSEGCDWREGIGAAGIDSGLQRDVGFDVDDGTTPSNFLILYVTLILSRINNKLGSVIFLRRIVFTECMLRMPLIDAAYCYTSRTLRGLCVRIGHTGVRTLAPPIANTIERFVHIGITAPSRHKAKQRGGLYTVRLVDCPRSFDSMHVQWPERIRVEL